MQLRALVVYLRAAFGVAARQAFAWLAGLLLCAACGDNIHEADDQPDTPAKVVTSITPNPLTAGDTLTATCKVLDDNGNLLTGYTPTFAISPVDSNTVITDLSAVVTKAGHYAGQCSIPGVAGDNVGFDVVHALAAKITIGKDPDQTVYAIDFPVTITHAVFDKYDNPIDDAVVINTSMPVTGTGPVTPQGNDGFMYGSEGKYHVHALVMPPTDPGSDASADLDLIVNQNGPKISCGAPVDASMLNIASGATIPFTGTAVDVNGTMSVTVNGAQVAVDGNGAFSSNVVVRFGINFVDVEATDAYGVTTAKVCTFLAASQWAGNNASYNDTISLRLGQGAIDDGPRTGAINSLGDMLNTVANSSGLHSALDSALLASNPLKAESCDSQTCVFGVCVCWYKTGIDYQSSSLPGPNLDSLALVANGVSVSEHITSPTINLHVFGDVGPVPFDTSGPVTIAFINVAATFDVSLSSGHPHMSIRAGSVAVTVGNISTNFNGIDGWIIDNIIVPLAQGTLKNTVSSLVSSYITSNFNAVLDGVLSNLDISSLGSTFNVPRLDSGTVQLAFTPSFTSLSTSSQRMLFGIGTQLAAAAVNGYVTLGVPVPPGPVLTDPATGAPAAVAAHVAILNQALHTLWKANYFHATVDGSVLGSGSNSTIDIDARLPPVAEISNGTVLLSLGDLDLTINSPGQPSVSLTAGIRAHASVTLVGNTLSFGSIVLDETHLSSDLIDLTAMQQQQLQMTIASLAQNIIDTSLNNALPAIPIPSFQLPASLAAYGLPSGYSLGITTPSLTLTPPHFVLNGGFGIQ